jgi:outer membrane protein
MKLKNPNILLQFKCLLSVFLCFCFAHVTAQETKLLSLEEATQLATNHDLQLKADTAQIAILNARFNNNKKSTLPDVGLNLNYTRISDNITPFTVNFPTGDVTLNPQILNQSFNSFQLKQLIWSGGKANYGIAISKKELEAAKFDLDKNKANTIYNVAALWYNLYVLKTSKQIIEANIKTLVLSQQDVKNFVQQGVALDNDALKIDLAVTNLQSNLVDISNSIKALNFNLCVFTGLPANTIIELPEMSQSVFVNENTIDNYITTAIVNRAELKSMKAYKDIAGLGLKISKSNYMPTISGIASGNYNLPEQRVFPNQNKFTATWFAGISLNWSLSNFYKNPDKVNESKQNIIKTNAVYNQLQEGIMIEVNSAYTDYLQAAEKIVITKKAVEQATENFRVEQNRLSAATITLTDFLDANAKLLQANLNLNAANANAQLAIKKLNKTIGQ